MSDDFKPSGIRGTIVGVVVADPEDKFSDGVVRIRYAVDSGYSAKDGSGWKKTGTRFIEHAAFGEFGDVLKQFHKGDRIEIADTNLSIREYTDKDGNKRTADESKFGTIVLLQKAGEGKSSGDGFAPKDSQGGF